MDYSAFSAPQQYLEHQVCGFEAALAAATIKAPLTRHEDWRLQDVSTAPVVLETAIIKVHRQAQRLKIESHCKKHHRKMLQNKEPRKKNKSEREPKAC